QQRQHRDAIAERIRRRDHCAYEQARTGEAVQRRGSIARDERVEKSAQADADEREREHESEGEDRAAEQWSEQAIPDQLEKEESEADGRRRGEEKGGQGRGGMGGRGRMGGR